MNTVSKSPEKNSKTTGKRAGTAVRAKGQKRVEDILKAAKTLLIEQGYEQFSLRNIAGMAGIHLSNLQYYFPGKDELIHALMKSVAAEYKKNYEEMFSNLPDEPILRFESVVKFHISDIKNARTRRFFIQFWALLEASDVHTGVLLDELYSYNINDWTGLIRQINPELSAGQTQQRATMISALIEGMMLMIRDADISLEKGEEAIEDVLTKQIYQIAAPQLLADKGFDKNN